MGGNLNFFLGFLGRGPPVAVLLQGIFRISLVGGVSPWTLRYANLVCRDVSLFVMGSMLACWMVRSEG